MFSNQEIQKLWKSCGSEAEQAGLQGLQRSPGF